MIQNEVLILYSHNDKYRVGELINNLNEMGVTVKTVDSMLMPGEAWADTVASCIQKERNIVFFISERSLNSETLRQEILYAIDCAKNRDKLVIPIVEWENLLKKDQSLKVLLDNRQVIFPDDGLHSRSDQRDIAGRIYEIIAASGTKELLYDKIAGFSKIHYYPGIITHLCDLAMILCEEITKEHREFVRRDLYKEVLRCMEQLERCNERDYSGDARGRAHKRLGTLKKVEEIFHHKDFLKLDLFIISLALRLNYLDSEIRTDCVDVITYGDVRPKLEDNTIRQTLYLKLYNSQIVAENISDTNHGMYPEDEISIILHTKDYLLSENREGKAHKEIVTRDITDQEQQLFAIAEHMRQCNKLFELLSDKKPPSDYLKCLKTSYERLRKYSEVVGCLEICADCIERIAEINQQMASFCDLAVQDEVVTSGIKAFLGFTLPGKDHFDVFLSYKHEDVDIARSMYHYLRSNILFPFFDAISLPELSDSEYEDAIMNAIDHSKHFVIILSKLEYLESYWVQLEMKTFRHEMVEGRKENANFLMVVTDDVFKEISSSNKRCLPIQYRSCEIMRVDEYREKIIPYLR